jgi:molybdopterin converting factor small subunit
MAEVHLPTTLQPLFPGLTRCEQVEAGTVRGAIDELNTRWPGFRDRLCEPGPKLRRHIHVYVERERADLDAAIDEKTRVDVIAAITGG